MYKNICDGLGLKGIIIEGNFINIKNKNLVETTDLLPQNILMKLITQSRFMLIPNVEDVPYFN